MAQLFAQQDRQPDVWVMSGAPTATVVYLSLETTINYSSGSPDTLPANTPAAIYGTSDTAFDRSLDVWVPFTVRASRILSIIKESALATLTVYYVAMARVELHGIKPYQPEPYLASGALGAAPTTPLAPLSAAAGTGKAFIVTSAEPSGWQTPGFDDSAWGAVLADPTSRGPSQQIAGAQWVTAQTGIQANAAVFLLRHTFVAPSAVISSATLTVDEDNYAAAYLNGTLVYSYNRESTDPSGPHSADALAALLPGRTNVLAIRIENTTLPGPGPYAVVYQLAMAGGSSGGPGLVNPGGAEGDLLYYHAGAWVDLPLGPSGDVLTSNGTDPGWAVPASSGTVTSVALSMPGEFSVAGSPVVSAGTLAVSKATQAAHSVYAGPSSGSAAAPTFRTLAGADLPAAAGSGGHVHAHGKFL